MSITAERQLYFQPPPGSYVDLGHELGEKNVGWWVPNQYGSAVMNDISGKNNHAVLHMDPPNDYVQGRFGGELALAYDGLNDYAATSNIIGGMVGFSIGIWFKTTTTDAGIIGCYGGVGANEHYGLRVDAADADGTLIFYCDVGINWQWVKTTDNIWNDGFWHMILCTRDSIGVLRIYTDGALNNTKATGQAQTVDPANPNTIGRDDVWHGAGGGPLAGEVGYAAIWQRTYTTQQVEWLHDQPNAPLITPKPRRSYWYTEVAVGQPTMRRWGGVPYMGTITTGRRSW